MKYFDMKYYYKDQSEQQALYSQYQNKTLKPTSKEKLIINPKVAFEISEADIANSVPTEFLKANSNLYGNISILSYRDPVSNLKWDMLQFMNSDVFRPAALAFLKSELENKGTKIKPSYTSHLKGTKSYSKFWKEEFRRINYGYEPIVDGSPCGIRISGEFYFYLNYCLIDLIEETKEGGTISRKTFPKFLVMDYYYFRELEARENPERFNLPPDYKKSIVLAKSRRKGMSYKAAAGCVWIITFNNHARVGVASEANTSDATDAVKMVRKCFPILDHLSNYTPFGRKDPGDPSKNGGWKHETARDTNAQVVITLGMFNTKTKEKVGRQSTIFTMTTTKDDGASGEGLRRLYFEEGGKIGNLDKVWIFAKETLKAGSYYRGLAIIFGTGGEMTTSSGKNGSSKPFSELFYGPKASDTAAFKNIYEYKETNRMCGYFMCDMWSNFGSYIVMEGTHYKGLDNMGNPYFWVAEAYLNIERLQKHPPNDSQEKYNKFLTQRCKTPSEAFLVTSGSIFNTTDLIALRSRMKISVGGFDKFRIPGELVEISNRIEFNPNPNLIPILNLDISLENREGCLLMYEKPRKIYGAIPDDAYIIAVDPIGQNTSGGISLNSVVVLKTPKYEQFIGPEAIVATYHGRAATRPLDYLHQLLMKLSKYYNAKISYENDRDGGILNYFTSKNAIVRLMPSPMMVVSKHIPNSKTLLREFGHSMASKRHKALGEQYLNEWLDYRHSKKNKVNVNGEIVEVEGMRNLDLLKDEFIVEQLIHYNREGNFDGVMALMGGIIQFKERYDPDSIVIHNKSYADKMSDELVDYYLEKYTDEQTKYQYSRRRSQLKNHKNLGNKNSLTKNEEDAQNSIEFLY